MLTFKLIATSFLQFPTGLIKYFVLTLPTIFITVSFKKEHHLHVDPFSSSVCVSLCLGLSVFLSAPGHVQQLLVQHSDETSVCVQWRPPLGEWGKYSVYLTDVGGGVKKRQTLSREINECSFHDLTPGKAYNITVVTHSGDLNSFTSITTHTSETLHPQTFIYRIKLWARPGN